MQIGWAAVLYMFAITNLRNLGGEECMFLQSSSFAAKEGCESFVHCGASRL